MKDQTKKGNQKTLHNFYEAYPKLTETWFCNADEHADVTGDVEFTVDETGLPLLYIPDLDSCLNPTDLLANIAEDDDIAFEEYLRSSTWKSIVEKAFDFFTK